MQQTCCPSLAFSSVTAACMALSLESGAHGGIYYARVRGIGPQGDPVVGQYGPVAVGYDHHAVCAPPRHRVSALVGPLAVGGGVGDHFVVGDLLIRRGGRGADTGLEEEYLRAPDAAAC